MPQDPFPLPPGDAEEPDGFPLPPEAEEDGPEGMGQGLYVCLPAEQVTLSGFSQGGEADTMTPGPLLAAIVDTVTGPDGQGLAGCSDDQLLGIISAARRLAARAAWTELAAIAAYAARHGGSRAADEFAPVELGFELNLSPQSAAEQMHYASAVAGRLPATFAALAAGQIHAVGLRIIEEETSILSDADAARAVPAPVLARLRLPPLARGPGRAWRRWSPSPSPWPPGRAAPRPPARPTGSGSWTATTPATWPPPPPATPAPAGA
jgi:hypothetical protein